MYLFDRFVVYTTSGSKIFISQVDTQRTDLFGKYLLCIAVTSLTVTRWKIKIIAGIRCTITFKIIEVRCSRHHIGSFHHTFFIVDIFRQFSTIPNQISGIPKCCKASFSFSALDQFSIIIITNWSTLCSKTITFITFQGGN